MMIGSRVIDVDMDLVEEAVRWALEADGKLTTSEINRVAVREVKRQVDAGIAKLLVTGDATFDPHGVGKGLRWQAK